MRMPLGNTGRQPQELCSKWCTHPLPLAANRIDEGLRHLSNLSIVRDAVALGVERQPRMGSLGAWWLGEAGWRFGELRDQVAADKAAKKRGEDPNGGALTLKTLAIAGVGSDEESEGEQPKTYKAEQPTSSAIMRMGATLKAKAVQAKSRAAEKAAGVRQGVGTPRVRRLSIDRWYRFGRYGPVSACEEPKDPL